jgi:hypothetical protein
MRLSRINFLPLVRYARSLRQFGIYAAIALVVPGGSLIALSAWALRHRRPGARSTSG